jgi:hypothetical protein
MASHALINELTPSLPKDEAARKIKQLNAMLEAATMTDAVITKEMRK